VIMEDRSPATQRRILDYLDYLSKQPQGFVYKDEEKKKVMIASLKEEHQVKDVSCKKQDSITDLNKKYVACLECPLALAGRAQVVFGKGNPESPLMFVGEGPGRDEDLQGAPFVGRAGQLLTKIIEAMGLTRDQVYISNVVKCRPPNNRVPLPIESETCKRLILFKEIEIIKPKVICALGATATQALLGDNVTISKARGIFFEYRGTLVLPTYHPAYLLRNPAEKKTVWEDMKKIMEKLKT
jgi:uracil-DNA glycosylase family 4